MINENVQDEPADSYDVELAGQLAAIGIVKGKPFKPDERMKKILTDAAAVGNAAGRALNWRFRRRASGLGVLPGLDVGQHAVGGRRHFETPPPLFTRRACSSRCRRPAPARSTRARRSTTATRSTRRA